MREIKFRVWDEGEERFWHFGLQDILERRMVYRGSWDEKVARYKKTQYTGIKDKNDVEIYEGDIIKGLHDFGPGGMVERIAEVHFHETQGYQWNYWDLETIRVVGNIYEKLEEPL